LMLGGSDILCREAVGSISLALLGRLLHEAKLGPSPNAVGPFFFSAALGHDEIGIPRAALGTALTPRPGRDRAGQSACLITKAIGRVIT
jgi:hypothetical protein